MRSRKDKPHKDFDNRKEKINENIDPYIYLTLKKIECDRRRKNYSFQKFFLQTIEGKNMFQITIKNLLSKIPLFQVLLKKNPQ